MARLQLLQADQPDAPLYPGATVSSDALMAPARGAQAIAGAVGELGDRMADLAQRLQAAKNAATQADAERQMQQSFADYQNKLATSNDEEKWVPDWQAQLNQTKQGIFSGTNLPPEVRRNLEQRFLDFQQKTEVSVQTQATARTIERQTTKLQNAAEYMWRAGDYERGAVFIDQAAKAGLMTPEAADALKMKGGEIVDMSNVQSLILKYPSSASDWITAKNKDGSWENFSHLTEQQRYEMVRRARVAASAERTATVQDFVERQQAGSLIPQDEIDRAVKANKLTATQGRWVMQNQRRLGRDPNLVTDYAETLREVDRYDPAQDPTNERFAALHARMLQFPEDWQQEVNRRLQKARNPTSDTARERDANAYIDRLYASNMLGDIRDQPAKLPNGDPNPKEGEPFDKAAFLAANERVVHLKSQLAAFLAAHPKASPEEQTAFLNALLRTDRTKQGATPLLNGISGRKQP